MNNNDEESPIQEFYRGRKVLVTGATGFMGKVLIEKLLRCTQVKTLYMLVRSKKGKTIQQRIDEYFEDVIFVRLKEEVKDYLTRIAPIEGDVSLLRLGLSSTDMLALQEDVEVLFHGAATVRFDEKLDRAIMTNVRGTKEVLLIAKACVKLKAFVHISTAYANCTKSEIHEELFLPPLSGDSAIQLTECLSQKQICKISQTLCGEYPNTYAFTKAIAENIVKVYGQSLPVVVFRPAIVVATANEPVKGWIDNIYGPTGVQCGVGAGVLRTFQVNEEYIAELVPVDMAVNALIVSAWDITQKRSEQMMAVYNYVSSCQNPLVWGQFINISLESGRQSPTVKALWFYTMYTTMSPVLFWIYTWLLHLIPALFMDSILFLTNKKPRMWGIYKKIHKFSSVITYFSMRQWKFHDTQLQKLWQGMSEKDQKIFNFDITTLDWGQFFNHTILGLRSNFFKDTPDTIPTARRKQLCFRMIHYLLEGLVVTALLWVPWRVFSLFG